VKASLGDNVNFHSGVTTGVVDGTGVNLLDGHLLAAIGSWMFVTNTSFRGFVSSYANNSKLIEFRRCEILG
jgi:hypothetical protein